MDAVTLDDVARRGRRAGRPSRGRCRWSGPSTTPDFDTVALSSAERVAGAAPGGTGSGRVTHASRRGRRRGPDGPRGVPGGGRGPGSRAGGGGRPRSGRHRPAPVAGADGGRAPGAPATSTPSARSGARWRWTSPWPRPPRAMRLVRRRTASTPWWAPPASPTTTSRTVAAFVRAGPAANCVLAANFAIGAVLMMRFAELAAPWFDGAEIIELHHDGKLDAPSGTALRTAERMADGPAAAGAAPWPPDRTTHDGGGRGARGRGPGRGADPLGAAPRAGRPPGGHLRGRRPEPDHPPRRLRPHVVHARGGPGREGGGRRGPGSPSGSSRCSASEPPGPAGVDEPAQRILEATYACVARWGLSKTTVEDAAREAGVSRATVTATSPVVATSSSTPWWRGPSLEFFARLYEQVHGAASPRGGAGAGPHLRPPVHRRARGAPAGDADRAGRAAAHPHGRVQPHPAGLIAGFLVPYLTSTAWPPGVDLHEAADFLARMVLSYIASPGRWDLDDPEQVAHAGPDRAAGRGGGRSRAEVARPGRRAAPGGRR